MAIEPALTCHIGRASLGRSSGGREAGAQKIDNASQPDDICSTKGNGAPRRRALAPAKANGRPGRWRGGFV